MKKIKSVAIVALGNSCAEYLMAKIRSESFDETWAINSMSSAIFHDKVFMMDPPSRFLDGEFAGKQTNSMKDRLLKKLDIPIYSCVLDKRCPDVVEYPLQKVLEKTKYAYLNNTVAYSLAYAIAFEFWLSVAISRGIKVNIASSSSLLDTNVPDAEKLYGYHRLPDPLISTVTQGSLLITKKSKLEPPEALDYNNVIGRKDIAGISYEEK